MKKMVRSMVAASLAGVMAVSLAGCGGNKQTPAETTAAVTDAAKPAETTAKETEAATAGEKVTLRFMHDCLNMRRNSTRLLRILRNQIRISKLKPQLLLGMS